MMEVVSVLPENSGTALCWSCKGKDHFKRNCPMIKCFFCEGNHLKKHCTKYFLEIKYKAWIGRKQQNKQADFIKKVVETVIPIKEQPKTTVVQVIEEKNSSQKIYSKRRVNLKPKKLTPEEKARKWIIAQSIIRNNLHISRQLPWNKQNRAIQKDIFEKENQLIKLKIEAERNKKERELDIERKRIADQFSRELEMERLNQLEMELNQKDILREKEVQIKRKEILVLQEKQREEIELLNLLECRKREEEKLREIEKRRKEVEIKEQQRKDDEINEKNKSFVPKTYKWKQGRYQRYREEDFQYYLSEDELEIINELDEKTYEEITLSYSELLQRLIILIDERDEKGKAYEDRLEYCRASMAKEKGGLNWIRWDLIEKYLPNRVPQLKTMLAYAQGKTLLKNW